MFGPTNDIYSHASGGVQNFFYQPQRQICKMCCPRRRTNLRTCVEIIYDRTLQSTIDLQNSKYELIKSLRNLKNRKRSVKC